MLTSLLQVQFNITQQAADQDLPFAQTGEGASQFFSTIVSALMAIALILVLLFLIWGAFDWLNSSGEKGKIDSARNKMTGAITGLFILASVFAIFAFLQSVFGIEILRIVLETPAGVTGVWI
jgi:hypothetical protein